MEALRAAGTAVWPERFPKSHLTEEARALFERLEPSLAEPGAATAETVAVAGRLVLFRPMGKLVFGQIQDSRGRLQVALRKDRLGEERFRLLVDHLDLGDHVGVRGPLFRTRTGEVTVQADEVVFLGKALRPLPEKWHGLSDTETRYRYRYLDLLGNPETVKRFRLRSAFVRETRRHLEDHAFEEVETPVLMTKPSGALARPFTTRHRALDIDVFLRIAPETYLKRLVVGGYERVYEFARCFRNEGMDPSHLQDFTMLEWYAAWWNFEDNMAYTESLLREVLGRLFGSGPLSVRGRTVDLSGEWPRLGLLDLVEERTGIRVREHAEAAGLRAAIRAKGIPIEDDGKMGWGSLVDALWKKACRPHLDGPVFITGHPIELSPLARRNDADALTADRYQLVVAGWEIVNAYSELVDPLDQRERLAAQARVKAGGDEEAMEMDEDYLFAMEHGMPPISGFGMGVDRVMALFTGVENLRDVVFFPLVRPLDRPPDAPG
ncbi:MAG: lysine--tRNA ligase [Planctomycetaceae bacterium]|nr:lysine--tRNA ligase [Planctomycetaceae bacterium]